MAIPVPTTFDPNAGPTLFEGRFTDMEVYDPTNVPNHVLDPSKPFTVHLEWEVVGLFVPALMNSTGYSPPTFQLELYAEVMGPGTDVIAATGSVPMNSGTTIPGGQSFATDLTVAASTLPEHIPGVHSGTYKLTCSLFCNFTLGPLDISGFVEGPIIKIENPV